MHRLSFDNLDDEDDSIDFESLSQLSECESIIGIDEIIDTKLKCVWGYLLNIVDQNTFELSKKVMQ